MKATTIIIISIPARERTCSFSRAAPDIDRLEQKIFPRGVSEE